MLSIRRVGLARSSCILRATYSHGFSTSIPRSRDTPPSAHINITKYSSDRGGSIRDTIKSQTSGTSSNSLRTHAIFRRLATSKYDELMQRDFGWKNKKDEFAALGITTESELQNNVDSFRNLIHKACDLASRRNAISKTTNPLFYALRHAFIEGDVPQLTKELRYSFQNFLMRSRFSRSIAATHRKIADFRFPYEWFPATRAMKRTIHLHVGPTNSGKTYHALKSLENAKTGIYAGPLRLLAHEVYSRFTAKGKPCALITGEEQRIPENEDNYFRSCTVEMTPLNHRVDVAVIDEIQMIGDNERGWAWTQAFLGVQATEVHLCGEERVVELIKSLCDTIGDDCVVHRYKRLSPLKTMSESLDNNLKNLQKGDAIVSFSRVGLHALKQAVEKATNRRCAIVYGSLPPETRAQQAALFNDPDNDYDFLVASDAIGMGLNLEIKRVIFEQTHKRDKNGYRAMSTSEIKQIGGRAGRFRTASQAMKTDSKDGSVVEPAVPPKPSNGSMGLVTSLDAADLSLVQESFNREPEPLETAGIQIPPSVLERFSSYFPPTTAFSYILLRLRDIAGVSHRFHMCGLGEMVEIADLIQPYPMSVYDRCVFLNAPVALRERSGPEVLQAMARCVSNMAGGHVLDIPELDLELLELQKETYSDGPAAYLSRLESLHKAITLYLWLSYRYSGVFRSQNLAFHIKAMVEERIDSQLAEVVYTQESRRAIRSKVRQRLATRDRKMNQILGDAGKEKIQHETVGDWDEEGHQEPLFEDPAEIETIKGLRKST
ncbi:ATP-dependent RNA helicase suv3- mitochondrial [Apiospora aurea]|uniref:RNA helicase n=1 Tax=Apiospora aurea TaxID=335848 RepID=A0ABR1QK20_9PEZI